MPKISDEPLEAIQLRLFKSDLTFLRTMHRGNIGVNYAIRTILRSYIMQTKAAADKKIDEMESRVEPMVESESVL